MWQCAIHRSVHRQRTAAQSITRNQAVGGDQVSTVGGRSALPESCQKRRYTQPHAASRLDSWQRPSPRGCVVIQGAARCGEPPAHRWHARVRGSNPLSSTTTTPQVIASPLIQRRFFPPPGCPIPGARVPLGDGASRIRTASGPQVMAALRNLAVGLLRLGGHTQIARRFARSTGIPPHALAFPGPPMNPQTPQTRSRRALDAPYEDPHQPPTSRDGHLVRYSRAQDGRDLRPREMFSLGRHEERTSQPRALR
jgi:hypothetical protein